MPEVTSDTWTGHMRRGAFEEAWEFSDKIVKSGLNRDYRNLPRHFQCIWNGQPLDGKRVLIRCYHGLGDTIQFIRYAGMVKKIAAEVIVWAQPKLLRLLESVEGIDRLLPLHDGAPEADYDIDVEIMELPHIFRTTVRTIPCKMPYFHIEPVYLSHESSRLSVGLVWQAGDWEKARSVPFSMIKQLFLIDGIDFIILQDDAESAGWQKGYGIHPGKASLYDHAGIISGLDLMITVDSMPAHLAGALNVPAWVMLSAEADWRWMEKRSDSPWYPSMKLFRQEHPGDWSSVTGQISSKLKNLVSFHTSRKI